MAVFSEDYVSGTRFCESVLLLFSWWETIRILRLWDRVRWIFQALYMIIGETVPFFVLFFSYTVMISFMLMALRDQDYDEWIDTWMTSYQLAYGEFEDEYLGDYEKIVYVFGTVFLILILSNMLIAFMGTVYAKAEENQDISDTLNKLVWIQEL